MNLTQIVFLRQIVAAFSEDQHPRDDHGRFATGNADNILHKKTGGQGGSNPGGFYKGKDGVDRYVKFYDNPSRGRCEAVANTLYRDLGISAPKSSIFPTNNGKEAYASEIIHDGQILQKAGVTKENAQAILKGFAADVLTSNWDTVGLVNDNILMKNGEAHRIDNGATFQYRAQGTPKPEGLLNKITEFDGFMNPSINPQYARIANKAGVTSGDQIPNIKGQVQNIVNLEKASGGWSNYLSSKAPFLTSTEHDKIAGMLTSRTALLKQKVGL